MPARKNHSKCRKKDHSNKGGVGIHKINHQKLQFSVDVNSTIEILNVVLIMQLNNVIIMKSQDILTEHQTGLQFLKQHGNISLFADGGYGAQIPEVSTASHLC